MLQPSDYAPNPHIAFVWMTIGGKPVTIDDMTGRPRHLENFKCDFSVDSIGTFEIVLFDPDYDFIENLVAQAKGECTFKFGYTTGRQSPTYKGFILEYVPQFLIDGIRLHLKGMLLGINLHQKLKTRVWTGKKIHEIVTEIATDNGFKPVVDNTNPVEYYEDNEDTALKHKRFQQHSSDLAFIMNKLRRQAVRAKDGASGYVFYFDYEKNEMHFHPPKNEEGPEKTFEWRHKMTEVIEFCPHYNGTLLAALLFGASSTNPSMNLTDTTMKANLKSDAKGTGTGPSTDPAKKMTEKPKSEVEFQEGGRTFTVHPDEYFAENDAKYWWYRYAWLAAFTGELKVVGDPKLKPFKKYNVIVKKKDGGLHWTSGLYWASGVSHEIQEGGYVSTLKLWRSGAKSGEKPTETLKG
jgi:hypothetical protein